MTDQTSVNPLPFLIVVTGRPGAGKTTLAHALAREIRCPAICRDEIKEGFVNTTGQAGEPGDNIAWHVYEAFFETVAVLLTRRVTLVAEAAFQHKLWAARLESFRSIARIRLLLCVIDPKLARARHVERGLADEIRVKFHHDRSAGAKREGIDPPIGDYDPPRLDVPTLAVDTSNGYRPSLDEIISFSFT